MKSRHKLGIILLSFGLFEFLFITVFFAYQGIPAWVDSGFLLPPTEQGGYPVPVFVLFPFALEFSGTVMPEFIMAIGDCNSCYPLNDIISRLGMTSQYIPGMSQFNLWDFLWSVSLYSGIIILVSSYFNSKRKRNEK